MDIVFVIINIDHSNDFIFMEVNPNRFCKDLGNIAVLHINFTVSTMRVHNIWISDCSFLAVTDMPIDNITAHVGVMSPG